MSKKIICILLSLAFAFGMTGCALFEHNYEADYQQVIARIAPITETRDVLQKHEDGTPQTDADGNEIYKKITFTTKEQVIYKSELVSMINSQLSTMLSQTEGMTVQQGIDSLYERLILQKLIINEADFKIAFGEIEWGLTQDNEVKKTVYTSIDAQLKNLCNEIRELRGEEVVSGEASDEEEKSTTYPVPEPEEGEDVKDTEKWTPPVSRYPGLYGDIDSISLDNEAMARLIQGLKENVEQDFRVTKAQKAEFDEEFAEMDRIAKDKGMAYVYPYLGETKVVDWIVGESARNNLKLTLLQEYLTDSVNVSDTDVLDKFDSLKNEQESTYEADYAAYKTAITATDSTTPILYHPDSNYFYVKHVLVPFSDAQKAELTAYKDAKTHTLDEIEAFREQMVDGIVAYAHVDGEDDKSRTYTAKAIFDEIANTMRRYSGAPREAERKFDEFIYKFNTDPGIFNNAKGYAVPYKLADGDTDTYMKEFAEAARKMYETLAVGDVYPEMVITDYGIHIMYLSGKTEAGYVSARDHETAGEYQTYFDLIKELQLSALRETEFSNWQQTRIAYYNKLSTDDIAEKDRVIVRYTKRFDDLYEG